MTTPAKTADTSVHRCLAQGVLDRARHAVGQRRNARLDGALVRSLAEVLDTLRAETYALGYTHGAADAALNMRHHHQPQTQNRKP